MPYRVGLASRRGGVLGSMTSGEGLMCEFQGPGVISIQSHKVDLVKQRSINCMPIEIFLLYLSLIAVMFLVIIGSQENDRMVLENYIHGGGSPSGRYHYRDWQRHFVEL